MKLIINDKEITIKKAYNFIYAFKGFMFKSNFNYGLIFKTNSIHTFFMKESIDVIQTDKNFIVINIFKSLSKNKIIISNRKTYYTIELPVNTVNNIKKGDKLNILD